MKKKTQRLIAVLLTIISIVSVFSSTCFALEWDGSSGGGAGRGTSADVRGFAVRRYPDDNCLGYRFSIVDKTGANKVSKVIDVFRNEYYGNYESTNAYKFNTKYNKKQLINYQNSGFSTSKNSTNCYKEADMGFATALGEPSTMKTWQANNNNLNKILSTLGAGSISTLKNGDKILVEPLYDVMIEGTYHSVTATELALYGKYFLGENSDGGSSSTASSWGFISVCTNKVYPNLLYTPDGQGLWTSATELTKRATFKTVINSGYGVGIAYTETKSDFSPDLSVKKLEAYNGSKGTKTFKYGTSTGDTFSTWTYGSGYPYSGASIWYSINFPAETENCYVKQTITVIGGSATSRKVYSDSGTWYDVSLTPTTVPNDQSYIKVRAQVDWIDSSGNVLKYGAAKTFYIPIKPTVYRYQVSAIDYSGNVQAYNGSGGSSGKVYVGQKVYAKYKYTAKNTWASSNYLYAAMHKWGGSDWVRVAGTNATDLFATASLSSSLSYEGTSTLGFVRVPDNSGSGSNVMHFKMTTQWVTDDTHTSESTWIDIPIVKPDVELYDMYFVNSSGYVVNQSNLTVGETVNVRHVYKNNTDCPLFVCGYKDDGTQIPGVYKIPANSTITVAAGTMVVPNKRTFSLWGGVYLEGAGIRNTSWETDGTNNCWTLICKSQCPVTIVSIAPNASYRENTDVISSFRVYNGCGDDYTNSNDLKVKFTVKKSDGTQIYTGSKNVVVPANDSNLVYFRWRVPAGLNGANVTVKAEVIENDTSYDYVSNSRSTVPFNYYTTPDTKYEEKAPSNFKVPSLPTTASDYATWSEYVYQNGTFVLKTYGIGISGTLAATLTPASGNSAEKDASGKWTMKSGYGVWLEASNSVSAVSGYLTPSINDYTNAQYAYSLFPEYNYQYGSGLCNTLYLSGGKWYFNVPNGAKTNLEYHFTPLYYPDGKYVIKVVKSDMWTPAGMIQSADTTTPITISGNAYDDWYVGRRT
jgi:hypothetical protein